MTPRISCDHVTPPRYTLSQPEGENSVTKGHHEIRDPIHNFVRLDSTERRVLDSAPFQRLRHIHQLGLTSLVYPGASHKRFEHSLGVMELASRVYLVITAQENLQDEARHRFAEDLESSPRRYWHRVLRMAALCHDLGHIPFSHAAERELLPTGWDHERITREIILSPEMLGIWAAQKPPLEPLDIVRLAIGPKKAQDVPFTDWQALLAEIIVGDAFGADRMDYLLRDSHHVGVAYGKFDHYRLVDTLRILSSPRADEGQAQSHELTLGIEVGGIHAAEALLLARYFMYSQVYFHHIRKIYDIHLADFLRIWLKTEGHPRGRFPTSVSAHLALTDNEIMAAILHASRDEQHPAHQPAQAIAGHRHFKMIFTPSPHEREVNSESGNLIATAAKAVFGARNVRHFRYREKGAPALFPVLSNSGVESSYAHSRTIGQLELLSVDYVYVHRDLFREAENWLVEKRAKIIQPPSEEAT